MSDQMKAYEIYVKHPVTGEDGWDIKLVWSHADMIEYYPNFDCVITVNDCTPTEVWV